MTKKILLIASAFASLNAAAQVNISGTVTEADGSNTVISYADIYLEDTEYETNSDDDGKYVLEAVEPGNYTLVISLDGFEEFTKEVTIENGKVYNYNASLSSGQENTIAEVSFQAKGSRETEKALLLEQKKAVEIKQSIGAAELSRKGISNVEQALTKTTGVTKVASRGIFVRGLDERYNYLTLNGLPTSPMNWETKIPSLDLFTSSIISNIDINKIFYTNLYGDFAGATINVNTKDKPKKSFTKISFSAGANLQSLSNDFITDKEDGKTHFFGFGGKNARQIPAELKGKSNGDVYSATGDKAINDFNADWNTEEIKAPISTGFGVQNGGVLIDNDKRKTSYVVGANYSNSFDSKIGSSELKNPNGDLIRRIKTDNSFNFKTNSNFLFSVFDKAGNNNMAFNYLFLKSTENQAGNTYGRFNEVGTNMLGLDTKFKQSFLHQLQLVGNYKIDDAKIKYGFTYGNSNYSQPDNNVVSLEETEPNQYVFSTSSSKFYKYYLDSQNDNLAATLGYELKLDAKNSDNQNKLYFGLDYNNENLDIYNRYILLNINSGAESINHNDLDASLASIFKSKVANYNELLDTPYLDINTQILSANFNYNHNFSDKLSVLIGTRLEQFQRQLGLEATPENAFEFQKLFILPSLNAKYVLNNRTNLRFAASKTYTKPKNIEIVNVTRQNSLGDLITGNPNLKNSDNYNADLKVEFFPTKKSLLSLNLFGKHIINPIEKLVQDNGSYIQTVFQNTDKATIVGAEIEARSSLDQITGNQVHSDLSFGANVTLMKSQTNISNALQEELNLTNAKRRLQGASDFLLNVDASYKKTFNHFLDSQFTLMYDTYSERISAVGSGASNLKYEDELEQPFHNLSFIWKNNFSNKLSTSLKVNNILNDSYQRTIKSNLGKEDVSTLNYTTGTSISLSASYKF